MKVKKTIKRTVAAFMCLIMVFTCFATSASAATNWPAISTSKYIKTYGKSGGNVYVYTNTACTNRGSATKYKSNYTSYNAYASASDEIYIYEIGSNYFYVSYPAGSKRKYGYVKKSDITTANSPESVYTARSSISTTYRRASSSSGKAGSISNGDNVYKLAVSGSYTQVLYNIGSASNPSGYRIAWITTSNYNSYIAPTVNYSTPLTSGTSYYITPKCAQNKVLDCNGAGKANGTNIQIWDKANVPNQKFKAVSAGNGYYYFVDNNSGRVLDINGGVAENFTNCQLWDYNGTNAQLFRLVSAGDGYYYMVSKINSNYQLDVNGAYSDNGTNVQLYWKNTSDAQKFKFTAVSATNNNNTSSIKYANYTGVRYDNSGVSSQRIAALDKAKQMVTIQWTAKESFRTWCSSGGSYNYVVATDGTKSTSFIAGKTYTGIPYSMKDHSYDDIKWANLVKSGKATSSYMNGTYYKHNKTTTAHGIDCSYFVYKAFSTAVSSYNLKYQTTSSMLNSGDYQKININNIKPGDIFLKSGHVMMYVGRSGSNYAVFEADAGDSKCSYNVYTYNTIKSYGAYRFKGFYD